LSDGWLGGEEVVDVDDVGATRLDENGERVDGVGSFSRSAAASIRLLSDSDEIREA
jgi:hypothetical protein